MLITEKKTNSDFINQIRNDGGYAAMDDGTRIYFVKELNSDNFDFDRYPKFLEQIKDEGLYGHVYVTGIIEPDDKDKKIDPVVLPIFGRSDKYETKWIRNTTIGGAIEQDFSDRSMRLKKRLDFFKKVTADGPADLGDLKTALKEAGYPSSMDYSRKLGEMLETNWAIKDGSIPHGYGFEFFYIKDGSYATKVYDRERDKWKVKKFGTRIDKIVSYLKEKESNEDD